MKNKVLVFILIMSLVFSFFTTVTVSAEEFPSNIICYSTGKEDCRMDDKEELLDAIECYRDRAWWMPNVSIMVWFVVDTTDERYPSKEYNEYLYEKNLEIFSVLDYESIVGDRYSTTASMSVPVEKLDVDAILQVASHEAVGRFIISLPIPPVDAEDEEDGAMQTGDAAVWSVLSCGAALLTLAYIAVRKKKI